MQFEPLIYWLLGASWLLLILVIVVQVLGTRRRRAAAARIAELEKALSDEREREYDRRMEMAENSLRLLELKESLESEKERSAKLLRNILPERVIADLQSRGRSDPETFEHVTVFFSDIVGFTRQSSQMKPAEVIAELSSIFTEFDRIFSSHHCERIKTVGDAYLSVSGLPVPDPDHCTNILAAAQEAMAFLKRRNRNSAVRWRMRFGVSSGPVVGGIVGVERYLYDIFGDTVNTAARMEQLSEPMRINVSEEVCRLASGKFRFEARPEQEVKGKGAMRMYFLEDSPAGEEEADGA